jgi:hypothetical protein
MLLDNGSHPSQPEWFKDERVYSIYGASLSFIVIASQFAWRKWKHRSSSDKDRIWLPAAQKSTRETIQGSCIVASIAQVLLGAIAVIGRKDGLDVGLLCSLVRPRTLTAMPKSSQVVELCYFPLHVVAIPEALAVQLHRSCGFRSSCCTQHLHLSGSCASHRRKCTF